MEFLLSLENGLLIMDEMLIVPAADRNQMWTLFYAPCGITHM